MTTSTRSIDLIGVGTTKLAAGVAVSRSVALDAAGKAGWRETGLPYRPVAHTTSDMARTRRSEDATPSTRGIA